MNLEEYKGVFVFAQQVDNKVSGIALELIGEGKRLAEKLSTEVTAVLVGSGVKDLADELAAYGADRVILVDVDDANLGLNGSPTKIAKASDKVRKGAGEKVVLDTPDESVDYIMDKLLTKHVI